MTDPQSGFWWLPSKRSETTCKAGFRALLWLKVLEPEDVIDGGVAVDKIYNGANAPLGGER
ncbi:hypothetical protein GCM10022249_24730 [Enteractinococcus coprophilus]